MEQGTLSCRIWHSLQSQDIVSGSFSNSCLWNLAYIGSKVPSSFKIYKSKMITGTWKHSSSWSHWKIIAQRFTMIARSIWLVLIRSKTIRPAFKVILDWKFASPFALPYVSKITREQWILTFYNNYWWKLSAFWGSTLNLWISLSIKAFFLVLGPINFCYSLICLLV